MHVWVVNICVEGSQHNTINFAYTNILDLYQHQVIFLVYLVNAGHDLT